MAQIITIDGKKYEVKQSKEEIDNIFYTSESIKTGIIFLDQQVTIIGWNKKEKIKTKKYKPITFIKNNIIAYF